MLAPRWTAVKSDVRSDSREGATGALTLPQEVPMSTMLKTQMKELTWINRWRWDTRIKRA